MEAIEMQDQGSIWRGGSANKFYTVVVGTELRKLAGICCSNMTRMWT